MTGQGFSPVTRIGVAMLGLASATAGVLDLAWGDFEAAHQPIQAFGDDIPGEKVLAYITGVWLIAGGASILWRRTGRGGAVALTIIYTIFAGFWLPRLYTAPYFLGFRATVFIGVLGGMASQLIVVAAADIVYASTDPQVSSWLRAVRVGRWIFGLCSVNFGLAHLTDVTSVARMVPKWMPLGGSFWTVVAGVAFVLAGLAILSRIADVLATRLLALMLLMFSALVLVPAILAFPRSHVAWGGNAYNLAAVGATLIFADSSARAATSCGNKSLDRHDEK